ncbi:hypothetical protein Pst134EA_001121 [Puccinia striiformis f. sp. tritici]|uniref:hypothetical protein n=1 Tax=Puccinia striiformis f. sp. tritici TaxID=168172 RepID=UPI00200847F0|nr:hypothetical protein Pst134EA_001121 [Puccinia striiformis f. sp. tritici]KAH9474070.1 hypothetical protein Pst134EA_001121 [Puccinia striiformis f. sp. tritici]
MLSRFRDPYRETRPEPVSNDLKSPPVKSAERFRRLVELTDSLKSSVGHRCDLKLPKIVILGGPLVKQIPLLECITGVKVPQEFEHNQRAPIEFRLINTIEADWYCQVKIIHGTLKNSQQDPAHVEDFGEMIRDPSKVEGALREAHSHLLRREYSAIGSRTNHVEVVSGGIENSSQRIHSFSKNVICLEIQGRSVVDLTLVTLPNFEPILSNQALHQFILDDHLATNCCIVLLTPESARLQAHQAFDLVQKVDPKGHRTIGLLSCADAAEAAQSSSTANISRAVQSGFRAFRSGSGGKSSLPSPSKPNDPVSRQGSFKSTRAPMAAWKVMRWQGPLFSEAVLEGAYDDPELVTYLGELFSELLNHSMSKLLGITSEIYSSPSSINSTSPEADENTRENEFSYAYAACAAEINDLATSTIIGDELGGEIEAIYELLGYRAFVDVPMFVPLPRKEDDHPAFKQLSELADTSLYPPAHQTAEPQMTDMRSRRPKVYLTDVQAHMKRKSSGNSHPFSEKTPLMDLPMVKWKSCAHDALSQVIRLLEDTIDMIIEQHCARTPSFQPKIKELVYSRLAVVFSAARESLHKALESELVPYTQSLQKLLGMRASLLETYHLSHHLLDRGDVKRGPVLTKKGDRHMPATSPTSFMPLESRGTFQVEKSQPKTNGWDAEVNACAEAAAYLNVALRNLLETTSMIIERDLLEEVATCDLAQYPFTLDDELEDLVINPDLDQDSRVPRTSPYPRGNFAPSSQVLHLVGEIQNIIQDEQEELLLDDPFMS